VELNHQSISTVWTSAIYSLIAHLEEMKELFWLSPGVVECMLMREIPIRSWKQTVLYFAVSGTGNF